MISLSLSLSLYIYIYIYTYVYTYMHMCIYIYIYIHAGASPVRPKLADGAQLDRRDRKVRRLALFPRHRLHRYLVQRVPSLFLASSFGMCLHCEVLKGMFPWKTRYPLS